MGQAAIARVIIITKAGEVNMRFAIGGNCTIFLGQELTVIRRFLDIHGDQRLVESPVNTLNRSDSTGTYEKGDGAGRDMFTVQ